MQALSIAVAFIAILTPGMILWLGIKWIAKRREASIKAAQDQEMREHDERLQRMASMRKPMSKQASQGLRAVPTSPRSEATTASSIDTSYPSPFFAGGLDFGSASVGEAPAAQYSGGGGSFDGGGATGDWSSPSDCSTSDSSSSSDSGSCGSGD